MLRGVVIGISRQADNSSNPRNVSTTQVVTCEIRNLPVEIRMPTAPDINEGDEIIVAGKSNDGKLLARAYRNFSNGASGHWDYDVGPWIILFLLILTLTCVIPVFLISQLAIVPIFGWIAFEKFRIYQAFHAIMSESPTAVASQPLDK